MDNTIRSFIPIPVLSFSMERHSDNDKGIEDYLSTGNSVAFNHESIWDELMRVSILTQDGLSSERFRCIGDEYEKGKIINHE